MNGLLADVCSMQPPDMKVMRLFLLSNGFAVEAEAGTAWAIVELRERKKFAFNPGKALVGPADGGVYHASDAVSKGLGLGLHAGGVRQWQHGSQGKERKAEHLERT